MGPSETPMGAAAWTPREARVDQTAASTTANTCSAALAATPALAMTALGDTTASWYRDSFQATIDKVKATGRIVLEGAERAAEGTSRTLFAAPCTQAMPCATTDLEGIFRVSARSGPNDVGNLMPKAFAPALVTVSLTGLVAIKDVGPGATMADTGEEEEVAMGLKGATKRDLEA